MMAEDGMREGRGDPWPLMLLAEAVQLAWPAVLGAVMVVVALVLLLRRRKR